MLAQISHRDDKVALVQNVFVRDRPVVVLELIALEAAADCEVSRREQHIASRLLVNVLAREREYQPPV